MDKHRTDSVGPNDLRFTLLDDYLHVVDTALWLAAVMRSCKAARC
jgi:virulence factor